MFVDFRPTSRLRGAKAIDAAAAIGPVFEALCEDSVDLAHLRMVCDWIQYRANFRDVRRQLHAAGLAPAADEDLGLDHDGAGAAAQDPFRGGARLGHGVGDLPVGYGQALGDEQRLGVGFLDLHEARQLRLREVGWGSVMVPRRAAACDGFRNEPRPAPRHTR